MQWEPPLPPSLPSSLSCPPSTSLSLQQGLSHHQEYMIRVGLPFRTRQQKFIGGSINQEIIGLLSFFLFLLQAVGESC